MEEELPMLADELKALRKGRGLGVLQIGERVGPALRQICGVIEGDSAVVIRRKVSEWVEAGAADLPDDLRLAVRAAFGLEREAQLLDYGQRLLWAAARLSRDVRTVRRRVDEAIALLVQATEVPPEPPAGDPSQAWHTDEMRVSLNLDREVPEALEYRRIVADRDEVRELALSITVPSYDHGRTVTADDLGVDVFYGGRLVQKVMSSTDRVGFVLTLPRTLGRGDTHEFMLRYRALTALQPHYICVLRHRCELLELRVRFDLDKLPSTVWRLADNFQRDVDDPIPIGEVMSTDAVGEIHTVFQRPTPGLAYGVRWANGSSPEPG